MIASQYVTISPDGRLLILNANNIDIYKDWLNKTSNMTHLRDSSESLKELGIMTFSRIIVGMKFIDSKDFDSTLVIPKVTTTTQESFEKTMILPKN